MSEQPASVPPPADDQDPAFTALAASIDRLDELGLRDELGRPVIEPAVTFRAE